MDKRIQEAAQRGLDELDGGGTEHRALRNFFRALAEDAPAKAEPAKKADGHAAPDAKKDGGKK